MCDNNEIKRFNPAGGSGPTVVAGTTSSGFADGFAATFKAPLGLSIESFGDILVADSGNNAVREVERIVNQHSHVLKPEATDEKAAVRPASLIRSSGPHAAQPRRGF